MKFADGLSVFNNFQEFVHFVSEKLSRPYRQSQRWLKIFRVQYLAEVFFSPYFCCHPSKMKRLHKFIFFQGTNVEQHQKNKT